MLGVNGMYVIFYWFILVEFFDLLLIGFVGWIVNCIVLSVLGIR